MFRLILLILLNLFGFKGVDTPKSLYKQEPMTVKLERWIGERIHILCFIILMLVFIVFVAACFFICGVSATESGMMYNHFGDVI